MLTVNYTHNNLRRTIEDLGVIVNGDEVYKYVNPGEGIATDDGAVGPDRRRSRRRSRSASTTRSSCRLTRRFSNNWFAQRELRVQPAVWQLRGLANSDEISDADDEHAPATTQQQAGSIARPGSSANRALGPRRGGVGRTRQPRRARPAGDGPPARREAVRLVHAAVRHAGRRVLLRRQRHAGEHGTVWTLNQIPVFVDGRGSMGRTPMLTQTDLLVSHDLKMGGDKRMRLELNVLNLFNQKTARHIFDSVNRPRRAIVGDRPEQHRSREGLRLQRAARRERRMGRKVASIRAYRMDDLFNPGTAGAHQREVHLLNPAPARRCPEQAAAAAGSDPRELGASNYRM